jgi:transketolase
MTNINYSNLANAVRFLSIDAVQKANSGHPGMPMGMADVATILFHKFLKFNPKNPSWPNRDRFVLSAGHGSMLLYSLLHLSGYEHFKINDLKNFRQLDSVCAGHPEFENNSGIETTTGPLGQGIANAVGFALAEEITRANFGSEICNHKTYVIAGDGCLMEGISHEAMSLAGHLKLKNLVLFFDNNSISIDGRTSLSISDDYKKRFASYNWDLIEIDGHNYNQITNAITKVQNAKKPTVISCKTIIGFGSPNKNNTASVHGSPLGKEEIQLVRKKLKWPYPEFVIPIEILSEWRSLIKKGQKIEEIWNKRFQKLKKDKKEEFIRINKGKLPKNFNTKIKEIKEKLLNNSKSIATRKASELCLEGLTNFIPELIGGSADLTGSNNTKASFQKIISSDNFKGSYIHYGIREHAMCGIMNGLSLYKNFIPYGGTFLVFSDYCKPSIRLAALMKLKVIYILTHDSIGLGEDGPTHQPIEHLLSLRSIPNLNVFRPADSIETLESWELALKNHSTPSVIALTRQDLPLIRKNKSKNNLTSLGGYVLSKSYSTKCNITIIATGSEVEIALNVQQKLQEKKIDAKIVSMPCLELFEKQKKKYQDEVLGKNNFIFTIEAGVTSGWEKFTRNKGLSFGINSFGKSAPYKEIFKYFRLTSEKISSEIIKIIS